MSKFAGLGLKVETPARMTILHPGTRQPLRIAGADDVAFLDLLSMDSAAAQAHQRAVTNRRLAARTRKLTAEEIEAEGVDLLVALTRGWRLATLDGQPLDVPFSTADARELYGAPEMAWLKLQASEFVGDAGNFLPATATS